MWDVSFVKRGTKISSLSLNNSRTHRPKNRLNLIYTESPSKQWIDGAPQRSHFLVLSFSWFQLHLIQNVYQFSSPNGFTDIVCDTSLYQKLQMEPFPFASSGKYLIFELFAFTRTPEVLKYLYSFSEQVEFTGFFSLLKKKKIKKSVLTLFVALDICNGCTCVQNHHFSCGRQNNFSLGWTRARSELFWIRPSNGTGCNCNVAAKFTNGSLGRDASIATDSQFFSKLLFLFFFCPFLSSLHHSKCLRNTD